MTPRVPPLPARLAARLAARVGTRARLGNPLRLKPRPPTTQAPAQTERFLVARLVWSCWKHAGDQRHIYLLFVAMLCLAQLALLAKPYLFGKSFDAIQQAGPALMSNVTHWLLLYGLMQILAWSFNGPARVMERNLAYTIRRNFFQHHYTLIRNLPLTWHQNNHAGEVINRTRKATDGLFDFAQNQFTLIGIVFSLAGPIIILFMLSWLVALVALTVNILAVVLLRYFDTRIMHWIARENEAEHTFSSGVLDYLGNMTTVITLRLGGRTEGELARRMGVMYQQFRHHVVLNETKYFILDSVITWVEIGIILLFIYQQLSTTGTVLIGTTVAVFRYLNTLSGAYFGFAGAYQNVQRQYTDLKSLDPIRQAESTLVRPTLESEGLAWNALTISGLTYTHRREDVTPGQPPPSGVHDVGLTIRRGQRIALVGESGSGKSTLLALMRGLYSADAGTLTADGQPVATLDLLADLTTLIPQQPEIFDNTVAYNIAVGLQHTPEDLMRVIRLARFESVLARLPHGLETGVRARGVHLSGGEKQRLALARGLFAAQGSALLLLDEPTSSLDSTNEAAIYQGLFQAYPEKAIIAAVHRLHLLPLFDTVVVMAGGRIVQQGPLEHVIQHEPFRTQWTRANP